MNIIASTGYSSTTSNYRARKAVPPPPNSFILLWEETRKQSRNHLHLWTSKPYREIGGLFWYPWYVLRQLLRSYEQRVLQEQDEKKQLCQLFYVWPVGGTLPAYSIFSVPCRNRYIPKYSEYFKSRTHNSYVYYFNWVAFLFILVIIRQLLLSKFLPYWSSIGDLNSHSQLGRLVC